MSKKSFKPKHSMNLFETSRQLDASSGEMYYDETHGFATKKDLWSYLQSSTNYSVSLVDVTSTQLNSTLSEHSLIRLSTILTSEFNIHGLSSNNKGKVIYLYNDTNNKMILKYRSSSEAMSSNRISTPQQKDISIPKYSMVTLVYGSDSLGDCWIVGSGSGSGGGTSFDHIQPNHGFTPLTPIYHNGVTWEKAQANSPLTLAIYLVTDASTNAFTATKFGLVEIPSHGLTIGEFYYVDINTAGAITPIEPIIGFSNPVLYVENNTNIHCLVHRPVAIGDGNVSDSDVSAVVAFATNIAPPGYLACNGAMYNVNDYPELFAKIGYSHGGSGLTFHVPDYQGRFLRGVSGTSGRDPDTLIRTAMNLGGNVGNNVGSIQGDGFKSHTHGGGTYTVTQVNGVGQPISGTSPAVQTGATGGLETRPINAYVNFFIRFSPRAVVKGAELNDTGSDVTLIADSNLNKVKQLVAGTNITLTETPTNITINASSGEIPTISQTLLKKGTILIDGVVLTNNLIGMVIEYVLTRPESGSNEKYRIGTLKISQNSNITNQFYVIDVNTIGGYLNTGASSGVFNIPSPDRNQLFFTDTEVNNYANNPTIKYKIVQVWYK